MKIFYINGIETLLHGKNKGLPITSKCRLDSIQTTMGKVIEPSKISTIPKNEINK